MDVFRHGSAGRSAERRYKRLSRAWPRRVLGRRFSVYFWAIYALLLILVVGRHPSGTWALYLGFGFGAAAAAWMLLPDALMPAQVFNWQLGAWGEQNTASELRQLERDGWVVRHDLRWGERGNHDHVVAGAAVYVVNSKNVKNSAITIEPQGLRVTHLDTGDSYLADRWTQAAEKEARSLRFKLSRALGFPLYVHPVVAVWGTFSAEHAYLGDVAVVRGDELAAWIKSRPADLPSPEKRAAVARVVRALPRA